MIRASLSALYSSTTPNKKTVGLYLTTKDKTVECAPVSRRLRRAIKQTVSTEI